MWVCNARSVVWSLCVVLTSAGVVSWVSGVTDAFNDLENCAIATCPLVQHALIPYALLKR